MDSTRESWRAYSDHVEPPPHFGAPTVQLVSGTAPTFTAAWGVTPSVVQTAFDPLCSCLHRRSGLPSRLKSATPTMFQSRSGTARMVSPPTKVTPLIYQTKLSPVEVLRQTISGLPSAVERRPSPLSRPSTTRSSLPWPHFARGGRVSRRR